MNQEHFTRVGEPRWAAFEKHLLALEQSPKHAQSAFPREFRGVCRDLAFARQRQFDTHVVERLDGLVMRAHQRFYARGHSGWHRLWRLIARSFPQAVRAQWRVVLLCHVLFYGSALSVFILVQHSPQTVYSFLGPSEAYAVETMYNPDGAQYLSPRSTGEDATMFGYYVMNNVSIAFRTFASGVFLGLGSLFMLLFNGIFLGAVAGHLGNAGFGDTLAAFVIGHGSFELTAIVLSAAAGLRLGWAIWAPGRYHRGHALRMAAREVLPLVYGSAIFLLIAAVIEAYWSSSQLLSPVVRFWVGSGGWLLVVFYLLRVGRAERGTSGPHE